MEETGSEKLSVLSKDTVSKQNHVLNLCTLTPESFRVYSFCIDTDDINDIHWNESIIHAIIIPCPLLVSLISYPSLFNKATSIHQVQNHINMVQTQNSTIRGKHVTKKVRNTQEYVERFIACQEVS